MRLRPQGKPTQHWVHHPLASCLPSCATRLRAAVLMAALLVLYVLCFAAASGRCAAELQTCVHQVIQVG